MGEPAQDKRKYTRFSIAIPVKYYSPDKEKLNETQTCDISVEGIGLFSVEELALDLPFNICLIIPDNNEEISLVAEVVWIKRIDNSRFRCGLKLIGAKLKPISLVLRTIYAKL